MKIPKKIQDLMPEKLNKGKEQCHCDLEPSCGCWWRTYNEAITEVEAVLPQIIALAEKRGAERERKRIRSSKLGQLMRFYASNRGSGHTYAVVKGVENSPNAVLLVANENQKASTGLPREKQITMNGREVLLGARRIAIVLDHYALQTLFEEALTQQKHAK